MAHPALKLEPARAPDPQPAPASRRGFRLNPVRIIMTVIVGYFLVLYGGQQVHMYRLRGEIAALHEQVTTAELTRSRLEEQVTYLGSDEYIEAVARRELGLVMPGETLISGVRQNSAPTQPGR